MSIALRQIFEQVHKLSRAEQLLLISSIAQLLKEDESGQMPVDAGVQTVLSHQPFISKGDKSMDPTSLFGIWASNPRNLKEIRQKAWKRN
jgi:hypothetical protein